LKAGGFWSLHMLQLDPAPLEGGKKPQNQAVTGFLCIAIRLALDDSESKNLESKEVPHVKLNIRQETEDVGSTRREPHQSKADQK